VQKVVKIDSAGSEKRFVIKMAELESSLHLYQPPLYRGTKGEWRKSFVDAVNDCEGKVTWDIAAILSILGFTYACGDRTLVNEVKRRLWLSRIGADKEPAIEEIPIYGLSAGVCAGVSLWLIPH
jgi:hypothetical protein